MPKLVEMCILSWKHYNPDYEIIIIDKASLPLYVTIDIGSLRHANDSPARFSDFVRLHVLSVHGGIWMDASVICQAPLDWIFAMQEARGFEFFAYRNRKHTLPELVGVCDVIETSVFACVPGAAMVIKWRDELMRINDYRDVTDYISAVQADGINLQNANIEPYWVVYVAQIAMLQRNPELNMTIFLEEACDTIMASYCARDAPSDLTDQVRNIYEGRFKDQPLIKLTHWERQKIAEMYPDLKPLFAF
ncbi:hypothetical protein TSOC_000513 [Tetrabaena socialis]|uniref:Uncharacterized protein n=1 Tax=Tetrabaena socialis TaxID=47790 RepID=A0A2J8AJ82_9CHLO|nr:hypothetical protein TSOC_000513 [Tetrabaena socialis]|eukprot:PNH12577.1 hypothetical protein TSOC_000513 [Tetrabaena socialis]